MKKSNCYFIASESPRNLYIWWQYFIDQNPISDIARYHEMSNSRVYQILYRCEYKRNLDPKNFEKMLERAV